MVPNQISELASVDPSVIMGNGNIIMPGAIIMANVRLGDNNYIGYNCIIGDVAEKVGWFDKEPNMVIIGNNNRFTKQVTIDSGTERATVIGNNVLMLKNAHVGHDAILHNNIVLSCNVVIGGFVEIQDDCNFGLGAVVHQRLVIPSKCMIGMNTTVTKKTVMASGMKYVGSPARELGPNVRT